MVVTVHLSANPLLSGMTYGPKADPLTDQFQLSPEEAEVLCNNQGAILMKRTLFHVRGHALCRPKQPRNKAEAGKSNNRSIIGLMLKKEGLAILRFGPSPSKRNRDNLAQNGAGMDLFKKAADGCYRGLRKIILKLLGSVACHIAEVDRHSLLSREVPNRSISPLNGQTFHTMLRVSRYLPSSLEQEVVIARDIGVTLT